MEEKTVDVGIFWVVPDRELGKQIIEIKKCYYVSEANSAGFVNYPYSHYEKWDEAARGKGDDCYKYPRGRVIYDANKSRYKIFADKCIAQSTIDDVATLFEIDNYKLCYDEHYVCAKCSQRSAKKSSTLKYKILRGQNKIGENLIEISYGETVILVELGKSLDGNDEQFEQEVLNKKYSAVVVSHYHEDHAGLITRKQDCRVYIGSGAYRVVSAMASYQNKTLPSNIVTYANGKPFYVEHIKVTPFLCDHSAFDSYMLLFEAGGKSILYTGDFRFHGRKDKRNLLSRLPKQVDVLIHEGTNIGKSSVAMTEAELESKAVEITKSNDKPVFVLQSGTNIDRLVSIYRASKRSGRVLYMDNYASLIASAIGGSVPRPDVFADVIAFTPRYVRGRRKDMFLEIENKWGINGIARGTSRFTMLIRPSMGDYISKLAGKTDLNGATLIYSMWSGYKDSANMSDFLHLVQGLGVNVVDLHTSGHAYAQDICLLKQTVGAKEEICVHTEKM